jgi:hypothetical protein
MSLDLFWCWRKYKQTLYSSNSMLHLVTAWIYVT